MLLFVFLTGCLLIAYLYYVLTIRAKKRKKLLNRVHRVLNLLYASKNCIKNTEDLSDKRIALAHTRYCISILEEYERTLN